MKPVISSCENLDNDRDSSTLPRITPLEHIPQSNKAATLSKLLRITKDFDTSTSSSSSSPLKALRDKSFPIVKPRLRNLPSVGSESVNSTTFLLDHDGENPCETPSYMTNADGNFLLNVEMFSECPQAEQLKTIEKRENPLPLPPKNRNSLQLNMTQKRHVRKHPLIIPATATQRTLDKINQITPVEDKSEIFGNFEAEASSSTLKHPYDIDDDDDDDDVFEDLKKDTKISQEFEKNVNHYGMIKSQEKNYTKDFIENNFPRTYENLEDFQKKFSYHDQSDTASLHFESILEDENVGNGSKISDDMVDGFAIFEMENNSKATAKNNISHNQLFFKGTDYKTLGASIEAKKNEFSQKFPKYKMPRNELASNALFNKIKESVEMAATMTEECEIELETENHQCKLKKSINHVSCEDLLDFSEKIPKGPERGAESDEVRILRKMFGSKVS